MRPSEGGEPINLAVGMLHGNRLWVAALGGIEVVKDGVAARSCDLKNYSLTGGATDTGDPVQVSVAGLEKPQGRTTVVRIVGIRKVVQHGDGSVWRQSVYDALAVDTAPDGAIEIAIIALNQGSVGKSDRAIKIMESSQDSRRGNLVDGAIRSGSIEVPAGSLE